MRPSSFVGAAALLAASAGAFEVTLPGLDVTVVVPNLPAIRVVAQPTTPGILHAATGEDGTYRVVLQVSQTDRPSTTRACAGTFLRSLVARPGMPDRDSIYRAALDQDTFLVLYLLGDAEIRHLHAHILSSAGADQCIEVHVSRALRAGEDEDDWRRSFLGARVQAARR